MKNICLSCSRSEEQVPLLLLRFRGETIYLCPQCLPVLIHKPERLAEKLPGMEVRPAEESHAH